MAKKKKKIKLTEHQQRKLDYAHRVKTYIRRAQELLLRMQFAETVKTLTKTDYTQMFGIRANPIKLDMTRASLYNKVARKTLQEILYDECGQRMVPLLSDEEQHDNRRISLVDFYEIWLPLAVLIDSNYPELYKSVKNNEEARLLKDFAFEEVPCEEINEENASTFEKLHYHVTLALDDITDTFCMKVSNPVSYYLYVEDTDLSQHPRTRRFNLDTRLVTEKSEPLKLVVDGKTRRAFRVKNVLLYPDYTTVQVPYHPQLNTNPDKRYPVYILEHAITRLFERIDGITPVAVNYFMNYSLIEWNVDWFKGSLMITYHILGKKLGYFVADIVGGKILIRTFLFITYNRTFEGELLNRCTGFEKLDKMFLNIDKLSTFMASDIEKNSFAGKLFREVKCEHLLDLDTVKMLSQKTLNESTTITNEFLMKYLKSNDDE